MTQEKQNDAIEAWERIVNISGITHESGDVLILGTVDVQDMRTIRTELERAQRMQEALEFYSDTGNYNQNFAPINPMNGMVDCGAEAKQALSDAPTIKPPYVINDDGEITQVKPQEGGICVRQNANYHTQNDLCPADCTQTKPQYGEWLPIESAPKDGATFLAFERGMVEREVPDMSGFLSGYDNGPDIVDVVAHKEPITIAFHDGVFLTMFGETYHENGFSTEFDLDDLKNNEYEGYNCLRLEGWMPLPDLPDAPKEGK